MLLRATRANENLMAILWCLRKKNSSGASSIPLPALRSANLATAELTAYVSRLGLNDHPLCDRIC